MKSLTLKISVGSKNGTSYEGQHTWAGLDDLAAKWFDNALAKITKEIAKVIGDKKTDGSTVTFQAIVDGSAHAPVTAVLRGNELKHLQREMNKLGAELIEYVPD